MQPRLWLASAAAVTVVTAGVYVASPTLHGQAGPAPAPPTTEHQRRPAPAPSDQDDLGRDLERAIEDALAASGLRDGGRLSADVQRAVEEATRYAEDVVRDIDVDVVVDDAMQEVAMLAGGRPRLGVSTRDVTADEARAAGLNGIAGAYVTEVAPDSAAAKAGLQAKDIITTLDGETVRSVRQLSRLISETPEGRALQLEYVRGTVRQTVTVTPEARAMTRGFRFSGPDGDGPVVRRFERRVLPDRESLGRPAPRLRERDGAMEQFFFRRGPEGGTRVWVGGRGRLGVMTQPLSGQLATYFGVPNGVLVTEVTENSPAAKAGMKAGDVITAINGTAVKDTGDILDQVCKVEAGTTVAVEISRDRARQTLTVTMAPPASTSDDRPAPRRMRFTA
jgi:serine protease Do